MLSQEAAKTGTSLDTLVGRLVIDLGLATREEVQACVEESKQAEEAKSRSLANILVQKDYVTHTQLARLKERIEAERKGRIPGFSEFRELGAGAMAKVYRAKQVTLDRYVAIKVLPKKFSKDPRFIERFYNEGRAAASLNHPNIVQAYDVNNVGDIYYFVMEYVEGRTVYDDIAQSKRYDEKRAIDVVEGVALALEHAHAKGLIHRDVKPKNIMITKDGVVKLADMGLARAVSDKEAAEAEAGKAFGTPYYISPEQIRGDVNIGPQADIYSLGATLYHMVTGRVPFDGKGPQEVMRKHMRTPIDPPDHVNPKLSNGISEIIEMMMAKDPRERHSSASDLLMDLRAVREGKKPPIAHKDVILEADLGELIGGDSQETEIREDSSGSGGGSLSELISKPPVLVLLAVLVLSLLANGVLVLISVGS